MTMISEGDESNLVQTSNLDSVNLLFNTIHIEDIKRLGLLQFNLNLSERSNI